MVCWINALTHMPLVVDSNSELWAAYRKVSPRYDVVDSSISGTIKKSLDTKIYLSTKVEKGICGAISNSFCWVSSHRVPHQLDILQTKGETENTVTIKLVQTSETDRPWDKFTFDLATVGKMNATLKYVKIADFDKNGTTDVALSLSDGAILIFAGECADRF